MQANMSANDPKRTTHLKFQANAQPTTNYLLKARQQKNQVRVFLRVLVWRAARVMEDTPQFRLASLQRKLRLLTEGRQATVTSIYASGIEAKCSMVGA